MKRETAIRYAHEIARRLHNVNGVLATPVCRSEAVRFKRVWVFGSTVKGSQTPNDLDLLIEAEECGRHYSWRQSRLDKEMRRRYGYMLAVSSIDESFKWLTKGMKRVSRHLVLYDLSVANPRVLIYPRNDLLQ